MNLKDKCKKLGIDYVALSMQGFSDKQILSMCKNLAKLEMSQQENDQPFWSFKMLDEPKKEAELLIYGMISSLSWCGDEVTPRNFNDELQALGDIDNLTLRINSPGGDIFAGNAIYNMLMRFKTQNNATITVYIDGIAASMASLVAMVGDKIIMPMNAMYMLHQPQGSVSGTSDKLRKTADVMDMIEISVVKAYMDKSGLSEKEVRSIMKAETYITAQDAVEKGFADEIENTAIAMCLSGENEMIINGLKFSNLPKFENKMQKTKVEQPKKEKIIMNLQQLCMLLGLDYTMLNTKGLSDDDIRLMCDNLQSKLPVGGTQRPAVPPAPVNEPQIKALAPQDVLEIQAVCSEFGLEMKKANEFVTANLSMEQVKMKILDELKLKNKPLLAPPTPPGAGIQMGEQEFDKIVMAASDGILMREGYGQKIQKPAEGSNIYRNMSMMQMAIDCALSMGISRPHSMTMDELFRMALTPDSQLSSIYTNTIQKSLALAYQEARPTCMDWVYVGSNKDFKSTRKYRISEAGVPKLITQNGEIKRDEVVDQSVQTVLSTYGERFGFTREAIINDDLGILTSVPMAYVNANWRLINQMAYAVLGNNSNISYTNNKGTTTTKAMFHADHKNYDSAGAVISTAAMSAGRAAMRTQKNIKGEATLNIQPAYMLVPAELETKARQFLFSDSDPNSGNAGVMNVNKNTMSLIVDGELDTYDSAQGWYMAASPTQAPAVEIDFLNGNQSPILESRQGFEFLGIDWRMYFDFAVTGIDFRGIYKNKGAAVPA